MTQEVRRTEDDPAPVKPEVTEPAKQEERSELKLDADDHTPEEAGYGYGV